MELWIYFLLAPRPEAGVEALVPAEGEVFGLAADHHLVLVEQLVVLAGCFEVIRLGFQLDFRSDSRLELEPLGWA
jgi:hypothetical protein